MVEVTQAEIARKVGVSRQAVGCALGDYTNTRIKLSPQTRDRIVKTAEQMRYVPHHAGRRLARARSDRSTSFDLVGLLNFTGARGEVDPACAAVMQGAEQELTGHNASLVFTRVNERGNWDKVERMARSSGVDGWLLHGAVDDEVISRLNSSSLRGVPYVIVGDHRCTQPVHSAGIDNFMVGRLAAEHLAGLGHRRVGVLHNGMQSLSEQRICEGFRTAAQELGLDDDEQLTANLGNIFVPVDAYHDQDFLRLDRNAGPLVDWLQGIEPKPTALLALGSDQARILGVFLTQAHIAIPEEISLMGVDLAVPSVRTLNFTRVELSMPAVGQQGAALLHRLVVGRLIESSQIRISPTLIQGWSTTNRRG